MTYYAQFNPDGSRITSYHSDIHTNIPTDVIEISDEDQDTYANGGYVRDMATGKPIPYVPKPDEVKQASNASIVAEIASLEATQHRAVRECILTGDKTRLQALDDKIVVLRSKLQN